MISIAEPVVLIGRLLLDFILFPCFEETGCTILQNSHQPDILNGVPRLVPIDSWWLDPFLPGGLGPRLGIFDMTTAVAYVFFRDAVRNVFHADGGRFP